MKKFPKIDKITVWVCGVRPPGPSFGGWAWVTENQYASGAESRKTDTTENKMRLMAILDAVYTLREKYHEIEVVVPSRILVKEIGRYGRWWRDPYYPRRQDREPAVFPQLFVPLFLAEEHTKITFLSVEQNEVDENIERARNIALAEMVTERALHLDRGWFKKPNDEQNMVSLSWANHKDGRLLAPLRL